jgi:hypothetical protein
MLIGLVVTPLLNGNQTAIWALFFVFTFFHLYANYRGVSSVIFDTINQQRYAFVILNSVTRADIILDDYFKLKEAAVLSPKQVAQVEKIFQFTSRNKTNLLFGGRIIDLTNNVDQLSEWKVLPCLILFRSFD